MANGTATEIGAKAQLQIGLCRLEQKRYPEAATALLVVPFTYDYPEWNAVALVEAARTFGELKQNEPGGQAAGARDSRLPGQQVGRGREGTAGGDQERVNRRLASVKPRQLRREPMATVTTKPMTAEEFYEWAIGRRTGTVI